MFKDLYKKANDKIPTDDAYLRVKEKVNTKPKKNNYGKFIALAACFILTFSMISVYEKFAPKEEVPFEVITPENLPTAEPSPVITKPLPKKLPDVPVTEETVEPINEPVTEEETVVPEETTLPAEIQEETETSENILPENVMVKNQGIPDGIGTSVARFTLGDTVSKDTYYEYLGKNIEEFLVLPEGFVNETPDEHILCLEETENFDDRWTFYFTKGDNSIFITTTKINTNVLNVLSNEEFEKSVFSGINAVIFEDDLQKIACVEANGISYTLSSYGVCDEDFENLIISLIK